MCTLAIEEYDCPFTQRNLLPLKMRKWWPGFHKLWGKQWVMDVYGTIMWMRSSGMWVVVLKRQMVIREKRTAKWAHLVLAVCGWIDSVDRDCFGGVLTVVIIIFLVARWLCRSRLLCNDHDQLWVHNDDLSSDSHALSSNFCTSLSDFRCLWVTLAYYWVMSSKQQFVK